MIRQIAFRRKSERGIVRRERVPDARRATELRALAFLRHEREADVLELELFRETLHDVRRSRGTSLPKKSVVILPSATGGSSGCR